MTQSLPAALASGLRQSESDSLDVLLALVDLAPGDAVGRVQQPALPGGPDVNAGAIGCRLGCVGVGLRCQVLPSVEV